MSVTDDDRDPLGRFPITGREVEPMTRSVRATKRMQAKLLVQSWIGEQVLARVPDEYFQDESRG